MTRKGNCSHEINIKIKFIEINKQGRKTNLFINKPSHFPYPTDGNNSK